MEEWDLNQEISSQIHSQELLILLSESISILRILMNANISSNWNRWKNRRNKNNRRNLDPIILHRKLSIKSKKYTAWTETSSKYLPSPFRKNRKRPNSISIVTNLLGDLPIPQNKYAIIENRVFTDKFNNFPNISKTLPQQEYPDHCKRVKKTLSNKWMPLFCQPQALQ